MYLGSVRFYKHLILLIMAFFLISTLSASFYFASKAAKLEKENIALRDNAGNFELFSRFPFNSPSFAYQSLYPELFVKNDFVFEYDKARSVYLTFDDGPSELTNEILDILFERHIRATFFVVYKEGAEADALYRRMIADGHTIALHSTTHDYDVIYQSMENFLTDLAGVSDRVEEATGYRPEIYRFPGGSINPHNIAIYKSATAELLRRGFVYYDWNVSADDAVSGTTQSRMVSNILNGVHAHDKSIVLLHDASGKQSTVNILPQILDTLLAEGYEFYPLSNRVRPIIFDYEKSKLTIKE